MMTPEIDLLEIDRGSISAPAGCGKTQLIAGAIARHTTLKPILILTHTNSGVAALRTRLAKAKVASSRYVVSTVDGWSMRIASSFPVRADIDPAILKLANPKVDYPNIREAALRLLETKALDEIISASYCRLIVDEYQDCSLVQHEIIKKLALLLPACVLGDPLQAIFGFAGTRLVHWDRDVRSYFAHKGELTTPWRWNNAGTSELGKWLLEVRYKLLNNIPIDLQNAPANVEWIQLNGNSEDHELLLKAASIKLATRGDRVLIIGESISAESRYRIAGGVHGAVTVEAVDLKDLIEFAKNVDLRSVNLLPMVANFAQSMMTNVGADNLVQRVASIQRGTARKQTNDVEATALKLIGDPSYVRIAQLLEAISADGGVRVYRQILLRSCYRAIQIAIAEEATSLYEAALKVRELQRVLGRDLPQRAVGSTLLLKGLEAECAVILNADKLGAKDLYVALTRGSKRLSICSRSRVLNPR